MDLFYFSVLIIGNFYLGRYYVKVQLKATLFIFDIGQSEEGLKHLSINMAHHEKIMGNSCLT